MFVTTYMFYFREYLIYLDTFLFINYNNISLVQEHYFYTPSQHVDHYFTKIRDSYWGIVNQFDMVEYSYFEFVPKQYHHKILFDNLSFFLSSDNTIEIPI